MSSSSKCVALLLCVIAVTNAAQLWGDRWLVTGVKTNNPKTDASPGNKFISIYYAGKDKLVRSDSTSSQDGKISSKTALFADNLYYINLFSDEFCLFEHIHPNSTDGGPRLIPSGDWPKTQAKFLRTQNVTSTLTNTVHTCNAYAVTRGSDISKSFLFFGFDMLSTDTFDLTYYEDTNNRLPVRFEATIEGVQTTFDITSSIFYEPTDEPWPKGVFYTNVKDSCH